MKEGVTDERVLDGVIRIRQIIDGFRTVDPTSAEGGTKGYLSLYSDLQASYAAALTAARRRRLDIPAWEGDALVYSPLVDKWVKIHDYL